MQSFHITGIAKGLITADRTKFEINLMTDQGPLRLTISSGHFDALITSLQGLEYHASLMDPANRAPGEQALSRVEIVESHQIGSSNVNNVPSVILRLKVGQVSRNFALRSEVATAIAESVSDEVSKLDDLGSSSH